MRGMNQNWHQARRSSKTTFGFSSTFIRRIRKKPETIVGCEVRPSYFGSGCTTGVNGPRCINARVIANASTAIRANATNAKSTVL